MPNPAPAGRYLVSMSCEVNNSNLGNSAQLKFLVNGNPITGRLGAGTTGSSELQIPASAANTDDWVLVSIAVIGLIPAGPVPVDFQLASVDNVSTVTIRNMNVILEKI